MNDVASLSVEDGVGVITIDSPPVNALGHKVRAAIGEGFRRFSADEMVEAMVLICAGRTFCAGADIAEFGKPPQSPTLPELLEEMDEGTKPLVAAIHGTALGGGYELALICHRRIAVPSAKVGLPEVHLGLLPGAGGTQRLPRIVGVEAALEIITGGKPVPAQKRHSNSAWSMRWPRKGSFARTPSRSHDGWRKKASRSIAFEIVGTRWRPRVGILRHLRISAARTPAPFVASARRKISSGPSRRRSNSPSMPA
jgi:hypothetical protein